jgi:hypothetical protein
MRRAGEAVRFDTHLVGTLPAKYRRFIREQGLADIVIWFDEHVSYTDLFGALERVDLVLFLIDAGVQNHKHYNRYKITGSSSLAKAYRKACASSTDFPMDGSLADKCFYYDGCNVQELNHQVRAGQISAGSVKAKAARYAGNRLFDLETQRQRLTSAVRGLFERRGNA